MARLWDSLGFDRRILSNIGVKALSETAVKAGRFLLILVAARTLDADGFGLYMFAFAFGSIFANASDFGLQMVLSREVARRHFPRNEVLGQIVRSKLALNLLVAIVLTVTILAYPRSADVKSLLLLAGAAALLQSWTELWNYFFRGIQVLKHEAWLNFVHMAIGTGLGIAVLLRGGGPGGLFVSLIIAAVVANALAILVLRSRRELVPAQRRAAIGPALRQAAPIGVAILLSILYFRIDVIFLERLRTDAEVGDYSAAYKVLESLLFVPSIFLAALYPAFAELASGGGRDLHRLYRSSLRWLGGLSLAFTVALVVGAPWILELLYGDSFASTVGVLRLLAPSLVFVFLNFGLTHFLVALGGQKWNAVFAGVCLAINAGTNALVIPTYGAAGAAATTVLTEAILFVLCYVAVRRRMPAAHPDLVP